MKKCFFLIYFLSAGAASNPQTMQIVQISIPKAGTHLLAKYISLLTGRSFVTTKDIKNFDDSKHHILSVKELNTLLNLPSDEFWITHLYYTKFYANFFKNKNCKTVFIYRDPRDQVVSLAYFIRSNPILWPEAARAPFDVLLMDLIVKGSMLNHWPPLIGNIKELYELYLPWLEIPFVLSIRFEDLVGAQGNGDNDMQFATAKNIAKFLGLPSEDAKIHRVLHTLFGNSGTFREGRIGSWKKHFKPNHIEAFKKIAGDILIKLNYEKDMNW